MAHDLIRVSEKWDGRVVVIALGPPPGNIITSRLIGEVSSELSRLSRGADATRVKAVVFQGEGKHFSFGASVEEHRPELVAEMLPRFHRLLGDIIECPVPTIARVSGLCLGGGFELALACSMIIAAESASFGVPEIKLGVFPPAASALLPYKAPEAAACRLILTGAQLPAGELHRLGLVNAVEPLDSLDSALDHFIEEEILPKSASSLRLACRAARGGLARHYRERIDELERLYLDSLMSTHDAREGIAAFLEKRAPKWQDS